jgi:serine/tyrosine/threonine adenylyltransferase
MPPCFENCRPLKFPSLEAVAATVLRESCKRSVQVAVPMALTVHPGMGARSPRRKRRLRVSDALNRNVADSPRATFPFDNSYARLPDRFYTRTPPTPVPAPRLIRLNRVLADELGIDVDALDDATATEVLAGNRVPDGAEPIATAYAGHQFGSFVPQLGDGRAILLGEVVDRSGVRRDIQLKGAGRTPFSRGGDGRAPFGPVLREYVVSEAMHALGIPTTRALAAVTTGEKVLRDRVLPGAVLTRVASSHIRIGTFEYFAHRGDTAGVRELADHVIARHYPAVADDERPYRALLDAVIAAQASLIAEWLCVGFIHGVMNTDNMSIAGETIDYGPCAFMDEYNAATVFSSIDQRGRYAYGNQPAIGQWNLARFAECLIPLLDDDQDAAIADATEALEAYAGLFENAYHAGLRRKLGLHTQQEGDVAFAGDLLQLMTDNGADFTLTFRRLSDAAADTTSGAAGDEGGDDVVRKLFIDTAAIDAWLARWRQRLEQEPGDASARRDAMRAVNPAFIPRNHRVEAVIRAAEDRDDFGPFEELLTVLSRPYEDQPEHEEYAEPPQEHERVLRTFCGT